MDRLKISAGNSSGYGYLLYLFFLLAALLLGITFPMRLDGATEYELT